jgi:hypothetical protein
MSTGPERRFINTVHRHIDPEWKLWKQGNSGIMGLSGTPDYYYEVMGTATWIEYKAVPGKFPQKISLHDSKKPYGLRPLQRLWVNRAHRNGVRVAVVLASAEGALIFIEGAWESTMNVEDIRGCATNASDVAHFAAGFENCRVVVEHNQDARIQHEHTSSGLHNR